MHTRSFAPETMPRNAGSQPANPCQEAGYPGSRVGENQAGCQVSPKAIELSSPTIRKMEDGLKEKPSAGTRF